MEDSMRFMIIRKADAATEAGVVPDEALIVAMTRYNEALIKAGVMLDGQGLKPSSAGARIRFRGGKPSIVDGPFSETKELVAGFTLIDVASREEALEWAKRWPAEDGHGHVELELRQVYEIEDFGDSAAVDALRERGTLTGR
jgi:hypothetical protein